MFITICRVLISRVRLTNSVSWTLQKVFVQIATSLEPTMCYCYWEKEEAPGYHLNSSWEHLKMLYFFLPRILFSSSMFRFVKECINKVEFCHCPSKLASHFLLSWNTCFSCMVCGDPWIWLPGPLPICTADCLLLSGQLHFFTLWSRQWTRKLFWFPKQHSCGGPTCSALAEAAPTTIRKESNSLVTPRTILASSQVIEDTLCHFSSLLM